MNILLVSSSARGHALAHSLDKSRHSPTIISACSSANPGLRELSSVQHVIDITNSSSALNIAKSSNFNFAIIGPEDPIAGGLADELEAIGIPSVAPYQSLARIESSKSFTRDLLAKHGIDCNPRYKRFTRAEKDDVRGFMEELGGNYVVKYDGLKGGKGVKISGEHLSTIDEGLSYALECIDEGGSVVVEEKLIGIEFSLISFVSGKHVVDCPIVQDHKRANEGDEGPNTGGMGTYSDANHSLPFLEPSDVARAKEINRATAAALQEECGQQYRGVLYGGYIATKDGVKLIEFNCRFGDPEALNILSILQSDFVEICQGIVNGNLTEDMVQFANQATVCKYIVPQSYPTAKNQRGEIVEFPVMPEGANIYFGDIHEGDNGSLLLGGSRTAGIVGIGESIAKAEEMTQMLCSKVNGPIRFRSDIGTEAVLKQRINTLKHLRSHE